MGVGSGWGNQGGCERRIGIFVQIPKKKIRGGGQVDVNEVLKFL